MEEETGFRAAEIEEHGVFYSSPGLTSESFSLVVAKRLERVGRGGGAGDEEIAVHTVAVGDVPAFIEQRRSAGSAIDAKLLLLLGRPVIGAV